MPDPPYPDGIQWPDRPVDGPGLHVPRSGHFELEAEAYSRTRVVTTERYEYLRFVEDGSDTLGHYERAAVVDREVRTATRVAGHRLSLGIGGRFAIALTADGFARNHWSSSLFVEQVEHDQYSPLNGLELRLRPFGSDTSAWAQAVTFAFSVHDEVAIASAGGALRFPIARGLCARAAAAVSAVATPTAGYAASEYGGMPPEPQPVDVTLALEHHTRRHVSVIAAYAWHGDRASAARAEDASVAAACALGLRTTLDAGVRFVTTPDPPEPTPFVGLSLR